MKARLSKLLASRAFVPVCALIAILLLLPVMRAGFMMDDYGQYAWVKGGPLGTTHGPWDMFRFQDEDRASFAKTLDLGYWPWWSSPDLKLAFFRPITSLTHALDHLLFRDSPMLMRLESTLIYALAIVMAGLAYRRILGASMLAGLALLLYAVDDAHIVTVSWIANRNAVLAAAFGFAAVYMHDRAVRDNDKRARIGAPILLALGLLSGEAAVGAVAYLFAHAVWLQEGKWTKRVGALAPYALVVVIWTALYKLGGYGAWGGEFYVDPGREPLRFAKLLAMRLPILLHGQFSFPPSDLWLLVPFEAHPIAFGIVLAGVILGALILVSGLRRTNQNGFFVTGMLLSLVPVCATFPGDRLLMFSGFGAFGLLADFMTASRETLPHARKMVVRVASGYLILLHLVLAPILCAGRGMTNVQMLHDPIERADKSFPPAAELAGKTAVMVVSADYLTPFYGLVTRPRRGEGDVIRLRMLSVAVQGKAMVTRTGAKTLDLTLSEGFFHESFSLVFRRADQLYNLGDKVKVDGMTATIKAYTSDRKRVATVEFEFEEPLDGGKYVWTMWNHGKVEKFDLPAVGESVEVPVTNFMDAMAPKG